MAGPPTLPPKEKRLGISNLLVEVPTPACRRTTRPFLNAMKLFKWLSRPLPCVAVRKSQPPLQNALEFLPHRLWGEAPLLVHIPLPPAAAQQLALLCSLTLN